MWRSQIFDNDWQGGLLLAVPAELASHWQTLEIEERPEGIHCCELVRWVPAE